MLHAIFQKLKYPLIRRTALLAVLLLLSLRADAQVKAPVDTANTTVVNIIRAGKMNGLNTDSGSYIKLVTDVQLEQNGSMMYCDSAILNQEKNNFEGFGNVRIIQPGGTQVESDYVRYTGNRKLAYLRGNASLTDGKNNLWCEELTYDLGTKIATYTDGGTLQTETTTLSSNAGTYNVRTKDSRFTGEVYVTDPKYNVESEDLGYNTDSKVVTFFGPSVVTNETSELRTSSGTYDTKRELANFTSRSSIRSEAQYIEGDKIDYDRISGFGKATGDVVAIDTAQHTTLWSGYAAYNERRRTLLATINPVMRRENGQDTLYIAADTLYSGPDLGNNRYFNPGTPAKSPTSQGRKGKKQKKDAVADSTVAALSDGPMGGVPEQPVDSSTPRFFIGYHHVLIFSDSLQGRCDSISYIQRDSVMRMMKDPVAWSRESQISGDTLLLYNDSGQIRRLYVPNNSFVVSQSGPEKAQFYDQVQGKTLTAFFKENTVDYMIVWPGAESIHYAKDESGAYLGVYEVQAERMKVFMGDGKIHRILYEQDVKQTMTPLDQNLPLMRLSRFRWRNDERPKTKEELFRKP